MGRLLDAVKAAKKEEEETTPPALAFPAISPAISIPTEDIDRTENELKGIWKVLDILQRPNYAIAGAVKAAIEGENIAKEAYKGITGQEREVFSDVLGSLGWKPETTAGKIARGVAGFALDVLLDPTTYVGISSLTKGGKVSQKTGKLATTASRQVAAGQKALITFMGEPIVKGQKVFDKAGDMVELFKGTQIGNSLGRSVIPNFRPAGVDPDIWKRLVKLKNSAKNLKHVKEQEAVDLATKVYVLSNDAVQTHGEKAILEMLTAIEKPGIAKGLPEDLQEIVKVSRSYLDELADLREATGKRILKAEDLEYLPHVHKDEFISDLKRIFGNARKYSTFDPSDIHRKVYKFTDEAGNELLGTADEFGLKTIKEGKKYPRYVDDNANVWEAVLPTVEEKLKKYDMETDIATLLGTAGRRGARLESAKYFLDNVKDLAVNKGGFDNITDIKKAIPVKAAGLKGYKFHPEISREIDAVYNKFTNIEEINDFVKLYDKSQNFWKATATFLNPAFHARNYISNQWQNFLGDVLPFTNAHKRASEIQFGILKNKALSEADAQIWEMYKREGLNRGFFDADIKRGIREQVKKTRNPFSIGRSTGDFVETNARLHHFIDKIEKGWSPEEASKSVKKFLFDYDDLTDFERNVFKRVIPFYTWTRKNIPIQIETLLTFPGKAVGFGKVKSELEQSLDTDRIDTTLLPEWLQEASPLVLGEKDGKLQVVKLEGYIPITDIAKFYPSQIGRYSLSMVSPFIKSLPEMFANYNTYFKTAISEHEGQKKDYLRLNVNPYLEYVLRQIRPTAELDKLIGKPYDTVSPQQKGINFLFGGKLYNIDIKRQKAINNYLKDKKIGKINASIRKAKKLNNKSEIRRLLDLKKEIKKR